MLPRSRITAPITAIILAICFLSIAVSPALSMTLDKNLRQDSWGSLNWSGYAVTGAVGSITSVSGSWTVPTVATSKPTTYVAFWAGIDGFTSGSVEQAGVLAIASKQGVSYSAWYEFYPAPMVTIPEISITPGETITVTIAYVETNNQFIITITDGTSTATRTQIVTGVERSSAEWIAERPSIGRSITKLADFGTVNFQQCTYSATSQVTLQSITMVNKKGQVLAQPSPITGTPADYSFSITYLKSS